MESDACEEPFERGWSSIIKKYLSRLFPVSVFGCFRFLLLLLQFSFLTYFFFFFFSVPFGIIITTILFLFYLLLFLLLLSSFSFSSFRSFFFFLFFSFFFFIFFPNPSSFFPTSFSSSFYSFFLFLFVFSFFLLIPLLHILSPYSSSSFRSCSLFLFFFSFFLLIPLPFFVLSPYSSFTKYALELNRNLFISLKQICLWFHLSNLIKSQLIHVRFIHFLIHLTILNTALLIHPFIKIVNKDKNLWFFCTEKLHLLRFSCWKSNIFMIDIFVKLW